VRAEDTRRPAAPPPAEAAPPLDEAAPRDEAAPPLDEAAPRRDEATGPDRSAAARPIVAAAAVATLLAVAYLLAPPLGTDLSAQVAHADFTRRYGFAAVDLRWYGGTVHYGYSLLSPVVMALLGPRPAGALALVVSAVALAVLLVRTGAPRPLLASVLGALCFAGNLVSGRVTYALGVAFGLAGLAALTAPRLRRAGGAAGAFLASATSPVAGLFVGLAAVAGRRPLTLGLAAAVPLGLGAALAGPAGWMNIGRTDALHAVLTGVAVAALVPWRTVRIGALLSSAGVLTAYAVHTPVGLNATRLATMFALPVVAGYAALRTRWLVPALLVVALWQPPVLVDDLRDAGNPTASAAYWRPLLDELRRRGPVGRIEVPPTRDYWEAAYAARAVPLARGWLRQTDLARNGLFFTGRPIEPGTYLDWLRDNGVSYVALPDATLSWVARTEGALVRSGPAYLSPVWHSPHWTLYEVAGRPSIVDGATLVAASGAAVTLDAPGPGDVLVRVRWSGWLRVDGSARLAPGPRGWTTLRVPAAGRYTVGSTGLRER
jgi:hypothetical protein